MKVPIFNYYYIVYSGIRFFFPKIVLINKKEKFWLIFIVT